MNGKELTSVRADIECVAKSLETSPKIMFEYRQSDNKFLGL